MGITLQRPVVERVPRYVRPARVRRVGVFDVPTSLRDHAWQVLGDMVHGPGGHWFTVGVFYPQSGARTVVVVRHAPGVGVEFGVVDAA